MSTKSTSVNFKDDSISWTFVPRLACHVCHKRTQTSFISTQHIKYTGTKQCNKNSPIFHRQIFSPIFHRQIFFSNFSLADFFSPSSQSSPDARAPGLRLPRRGSSPRQQETFIFLERFWCPQMSVILPPSRTSTRLGDIYYPLKLTNND